MKTMKTIPPVDTTPVTRTLPNGKVAVFYSPHQIEALVDVTKRLNKRFGGVFDPHTLDVSKKPNFV